MTSPVFESQRWSPRLHEEAGPSSGNIERHEQYYIPSGDVVFLVENKLFRVHRYFLLRESPLFRDMLSLPAPSGTELEGSSDKNPINLPQATSADFAAFLWVFYNPKYSIYQASVDTWTSILRLAHLYQCDEIRDLAFRELDRLHVPPVDRVLLVTKYDAKREWRDKALADLGARPEPLTLEEGQKLGLELSLRIARLRERVALRKGGRRSRGRYTNYRAGDGWGNWGEPVVVVPSRGPSRSPSPRSRTPSPGPPILGRTPSPTIIHAPQPVGPVHIHNADDLHDAHELFNF